MQTATMNDVDVQTDVTTEIENETDDLGKEGQKLLVPVGQRARRDFQFLGYLGKAIAFGPQMNEPALLIFLTEVVRLVLCLCGDTFRGINVIHGYCLHQSLSLVWICTSALIAALICPGSSGHAATISARSGGSSEVSICPCFRDLGVNWGVNCVFDISQVFVLAKLTLLVQRTLKTLLIF